MPNYQRRIVYLSEAQREELFSEGSITVNGTTITYDANDMYVTPQEEPYVKPASGIPASDLASGVVPDVRINGTSIVSNGVADFPSAGTDAFGLVKVGDGGLGVTINNSGVLRTLQAYTIHAKNGTDSYRPITPEIQHASTFYGLAKAAGDATQSESSNTVGTYTNEAKAAIQTMLDVPSNATVTSAIGTAIGNVHQFNIEVVQALPTENIQEHTVYFVPKTGETNDVYDEYVYVNNGWEMIGNTQIDLSNYVQKTDYATATNPGVVCVDSNLSPLTMWTHPATGKHLLMLNAGDSADIKAGESLTKPVIIMRQHEATFYGLAKAAGDSTQASSSNAVGTYTDSAKTAIRTMLGVPSSSDLNDKVDKSAIENAGITGYTYSTLFGGEFSVTTAASNDYISPYVRAAVTGRISKHYMHRVTFNGTEYILPTRLWFNDDASLKVYEYLGNLNLFISDVSGIPGGTDNVPFVIISDLNDSGSIDVLTQTSGTYTIKVERIVPTKKDLPKTLIYGDNYVPIETKNNDGTYNGFNIGVNELANTRATFAVGYGNQIAHEFGIAVGRRNSISSETGGGGTAVGTGNTISAAGGMALGSDNVVSGASAVAVGNGLIANTLNTTVLGMYNVPANTTFENFQTNHFYTSGTVVKGTWSSIIPVAFTCVCKADHVSGNSSYLYNDVDSQGYTYWEQISSDGDSTLIIGNGTVNERSNAIKIDIKGNSRIKGNVYVNCNADSSGGTKLVSQTDYATSTTAGVVKTGEAVYLDNKNKLCLSGATATQIKNGVNANYPITPSLEHSATFYGLAKAAGDTTQASSDNAVGTYTDDAKTAIRTMLGAVGKTDYATSSTGGTVKVNSNYGLTIDSGTIKVIAAGSASVKSGQNANVPIAASNQHESVFYGLAKIAGSDERNSSLAAGTYTNAAKTAIQTMLGVESGVSFVETVSGATPSITGEPNTRYMCGEVTSIAITSPSAGTIDVVFTSGSTPAVLTVAPPTGMTMKWPAWFDPTSLATNTTYEINIMDGVYGAVMAW